MGDLSKIMMHYRSLFPVIGCLAWLAPANAADGLSELKQTIKDETSALRSCEPESCPVFYVSVLGRAFPIPTRYMFFPAADAPGKGRFMSPVPAFSTVEKAVAGKEIAGLISLGTLEQLKRDEAAGGIKLQFLKTIEGVKMYSLTLEGRQDPAISYVLVAENEFIQIGDQNPQLAELLLSLSSRVKKLQTLR